MYNKASLSKRLKNIVKQYTIGEDESDLLYDLALQSGHDMAYQLDLPETQKIFPSLFRQIERKKQSQSKTLQKKEQDKVNIKDSFKGHNIVWSQSDQEPAQSKSVQINPVKQPIKVQIRIKQKNQNKPAQFQYPVPALALKKTKEQQKLQKKEAVQQQKPKPNQAPKNQKKKQTKRGLSDSRLAQNQHQQTFSRTIEDYSSIEYQPINDLNYLPQLQSKQEIGRFYDAIVLTANSHCKTLEKHQKMYQIYRQSGGKRTFDQFISKLIEDLLYCTNLQLLKPGYTAQDFNFKEPHFY